MLANEKIDSRDCQPSRGRYSFAGCSTSSSPRHGISTHPDVHERMKKGEFKERSRYGDRGRCHQAGYQIGAVETPVDESGVERANSIFKAGKKEMNSG